MQPNTFVMNVKCNQLRRMQPKRHILQKIVQFPSLSKSATWTYETSSLTSYNLFSWGIAQFFTLWPWSWLHFWLQMQAIGCIFARAREEWLWDRRKVAHVPKMQPSGCIYFAFGCIFNHFCMHFWLQMQAIGCIFGCKCNQKCNLQPKMQPMVAFMQPALVVISTVWCWDFVQL